MSTLGIISISSDRRVNHSWFSSPWSLLEMLPGHISTLDCPHDLKFYPNFQ